MKKLCLLYYLLFLISITACNLNPLGSRPDETRTKNPTIKFSKVAEKPADSLLIGTWEVDRFTYEFLRKHVDVDDRKVTLTLKKDRTLTSMNLPNMNSYNLYQPDSLLGKMTGSWEPEQSYKKDRWQVQLSFDWKGGTRYGFAGSYYIYKRNDSLFLWRYIGDPDSGNRLLFRKN